MPCTSKGTVRPRIKGTPWESSPSTMICLSGPTGTSSSPAARALIGRSTSMTRSGPVTVTRMVVTSAKGSTATAPESGPASEETGVQTPGLLQTCIPTGAVTTVILMLPTLELQPPRVAVSRAAMEQARVMGRWPAWAPG